MTIKAAVISLGSVSSKWTVKSMKNYFREVDHLNIKDIDVTLGSGEPEILYKGNPLEDYDCVFIKGSFRYATLSRAIASILRNKTYTPIKSTAFTVVHDKLLTQLKLQQNKLPMPKTYLAATPAAAKKILEKITYPIIMKFPQGTQGKGVMFAESFPAANSMLDALTALNQPFLIQEYIETDGADIRAIVVGDKVVAAMRRTAATGEKRSNIHAGGEGDVIQLDSHTKKVAVEAAKVVGADICGVDMLESTKGPMIIELNISPGLQGITKATKIDIADKMAKYLHKRTKEFVSKKKKVGAEEILKEIGEAGVAKEIITNLDFRGERILLPHVISKETGFTDKDELIFRVEKGKLVLEKLNIGKKER